MRFVTWPQVEMHTFYVVGLLALALCATASTNVSCPAQCSTDLDCSLNGVCLSGACSCDPAWTGTCCTSLNLLPAPVASSYRHANTSTWGGNIVQTKDGLYHMWVAEMYPAGVNGDPGAGSCGLTTWGERKQ